jgi:hypothetical protein
MCLYAVDAQVHLHHITVITGVQKYLDKIGCTERPEAARSWAVESAI